MSPHRVHQLEGSDSATPLTRAAVHSRLVDVEERRELLGYTVDGWCVWPIFRKVVADRLTQDFSYSAKRPGRVRPLWAYAARDVAALLRLKRAKLLVKTYTSGLLDETDEGKLRDIWFDDLILAHGDVIKLEGINNPAFLAQRERALRPSAATTTLLELTSRVLGGRVRLPALVGRTTRELSAVISTEFGDIISAPTVTAVVASFFWQRRLWGAILGRVKPETVIVADFGEYGLVAAARERGIRVLELQHGIADRHHPAYAWSGSALAQRARMPIAERMLLFGDHWKEELSQSEFWSGALDVVGSSRIDRYRALPRTSGIGPYRLLVAADGIESTETIRIVRELLAGATSIELDVIIKLHPVYSALDEEIRNAFAGEPRVSIRAASEGDSTFRILRSVDLHASVASASHYDALGLGTPTAILAAGSYRMVCHLHEAGHASLARNGRDLLDALKRARSSPVPTHVSNLYFREGAVEKILSVIDRARQSRSKPLL